MSASAPSSLPSDVSSFIQRKTSYALNEAKAGSHENLFQGDSSLACSSDADATLLIFLSLREPLRLSGLILEAPEEALAPTTVKVFINRPAMTFDDVEGAEPAATFELAPKDFGSVLKLKPMKFSHVGSMFVYAEREGAEVVALSKLALIGSAVGGTDVSAIKKVGSEEA
jgi:hypothetical protein